MVFIITKKMPMIMAACIPCLAQATNTGGIAASVMPMYGINPSIKVKSPQKIAKFMSKTRRIAETPTP